MLHIHNTNMEQITTALASLGAQAVPAMTCVHGQFIFSTDVHCSSLLATYYNVSISNHILGRLYCFQK